MVTIQIKVEVLNAQQVIKEKKGAFVGMIADWFVSDEKLQKEVEKKVAEELIGQLKEKIEQGLKDQHVDARISLSSNVLEKEV